jgi:Kdo2-lipid IVA lauroyltransferase/acyltransferase
VKIKIFKHFRFLLEYWFILTVLFIFKLMPFPVVKAFAWFCGTILYLLPPTRKLVIANISAAFPEYSLSRVREVARKSLCHTVMAPLEFVWMTSDPTRVEKYAYINDDIINTINEHHRKGEGIIYVNPHLGNWEVSALMVSHYTDIGMGIVIKQIRNPYINKLFNESRAFDNTRLIYAKGAVRGSLKALRDGLAIGILLDQNTKARKGGIFVNFFGIPVASSPAPFTLRQRVKNCHIYYGTAAKVDGRYIALTETLSKKFDDYVDEKEFLQEFMDLTERYIRKYPEQYLWLYKRFQYIPKEVDDATRKRYPYYAKEPSESFYRRSKKQ